MSIHVIGIDPSLTSTGLVSICGGVIKELAIKSKPCKEKNPTTETIRIMKIRDDISLFVRSLFPPSLVLIEGMAFMARNTSALVQLAALNYYIRELLIKHEIPFVIVAPTSLKKFAALKGNVDKNVVMLEVFKRWGFSPDGSDIADAFVLTQIGLALCGQPTKPLVKPQQEVINLLKDQYNYEN